MAGEEVTPFRCEVMYHILQKLLGYITLMFKMHLLKVEGVAEWLQENLLVKPEKVIDDAYTFSLACSGNVREKKHWDLAGSYYVYWICHSMLV